MKIKITTDNCPRASKPTENIGTINNAIKHIVETNIEGLSEMLGKGFTWTPAELDGKGRKASNWVSQQVFALDFDKDVSPEEVFEIAKKAGLTVNIFHPSFSDSPECRKFRVIFVLDTVITDAKMAKAITEALMVTIGGADKSCKDISRLFFGGKESTVVSTELNKFSDVLDITNCNVIASDKGQVRNVFCRNTSTSIVYNKTSGFSAISDNDIESAKNNTLSPDMVEKIDFNEIAKEVMIFNDFVNGVWLEHNCIFGIATSMVRIEGGAKFMKEIMVKYNAEGKTNYTANNFAAIPYAKKQNYEPKALRNYSPYEEDFQHFNLITAVRDVRGVIEILESAPKISIAEAEKIMKDAFKTAISSKENNITIIKVPTGLGKTEMLRDFSGVIAAPTNALKDEIYERVIMLKCKTPDAPVFENTKLNEEIAYLHTINLFKQAASRCHQVISDISVSQSDRDLAAAYMKQLIEAYSSYDTVVTTHSRALNSTFQHKTIVFDECPLQSLLPIKTLHIEDFIQIISDTKNKDVKMLMDVFMDLNVGQLYETPQCNIDFQKIIEDITATGSKNLKSDVISALNSDYIIRDTKNANLFHYILKKDLNIDNNYIILSATAPLEIYKAIWGDRIKITDVTDIEMVGKINQYTQKSYSREGLRAKNSISSLLKNLDTTLPTITFKEFISSIPNAVEEMYFGNAAGYDTLNGQSINVVGTPHLNNSTYMLLGAVAKIVLKPRDYVMDFREVVYGGFKFKFNCYENEKLAALQLALVESELIQAVGRARALRKDCTVYVYSNLPLNITTSFFNKFK